jgi:hypothetical protein
LKQKEEKTEKNISSKQPSKHKKHFNPSNCNLADRSLTLWFCPENQFNTDTGFDKIEQALFLLSKSNEHCYNISNVKASFFYFMCYTQRQ